MTGGGRGWLALAVVAYVLLATGWLFWTPALEAADETTHLQYALHVAQTGELPLARGSAARLARSPWDEETQAFQPPLYFALVGGLARALGAADTVVVPRINASRARPERGGAISTLNYVHGFDERPPYGPGMRLLLELRAASVLLGLLIVLLTFAIGRRAFPGDPAVAGLAALLVASLPRLLSEVASVHNETLAALLGHVAMALLLCGPAWRAPGPGRAALLGVVAGLGILSKLTALSLLPLIVAACLLPALRERRRPVARELLGALLALGAAAAVSGWWFARNERLYGDALALGPLLEQFRHIAHAPGAASGWLLGDFLPKFLGSFVGWFGWFAIPPLPAALIGGAALLALAAVGWELRLRRPVEPATAARPDAALLLALFMLLAFAQLVAYNAQVSGPDCRYVFGALGPAAVLVAAGLLSTWRSVARRGGGATRAAGAALALSLPLASGALLLFQARPALDGRLAPADRFHANLVTGVATPLAQPVIALLEPAEGARLVEPPLLRWSGDARRSPGVPYTLDIAFADGRPLLSSMEDSGIEIWDEELRLPEALWALLPADVPVLWRVRLLPNRAQGQTERDAPGSAFRSLVRAASR